MLRFEKMSLIWLSPSSSGYFRALHRNACSNTYRNECLQAWMNEWFHVDAANIREVTYRLTQPVKSASLNNLDRTVSHGESFWVGPMENLHWTIFNKINLILHRKSGACITSVGVTFTSCVILQFVLTRFQRWWKQAPRACLPRKQMWVCLPSPESGLALWLWPTAWHGNAARCERLAVSLCFFPPLLAGGPEASTPWSLEWQSHVRERPSSAQTQPQGDPCETSRGTTQSSHRIKQREIINHCSTWLRLDGFVTRRCMTESHLSTPTRQSRNAVERGTPLWLISCFQSCCSGNWWIMQYSFAEQW